MINKLWVIFGIIFLILSIFFVNRYVSSLMEEKFVEKCYSENLDPYSLALSELNESYCINITDGDYCYDQIMLLKSRIFLNASYCNLIKDEQKKYLCGMTIKENGYEVCNNLDGNDKLFCIAIFGHDLKKCNDLPNNDYSSEECKLFYYLYEEFNKRSDNPCFNLTGEYNYICRSILSKSVISNYPNFDYKENIKEDYCRREYLIQTGKLSS